MTNVQKIVINEYINIKILLCWFNVTMTGNTINRCIREKIKFDLRSNTDKIIFDKQWVTIL